VVAAPGDLATADELTEGWREDRREIRFSEQTIGRRDFLTGVLLGSVPVNPNRIPVLAKILRGRWKTAVSIAQDRRTDVIGALFHATRARIVQQAGPDRAWNPAEFKLTARPEVRPLGNAVQASFPFALSAGEHRVARVLLNSDGFEVALDE
jgi:hypothetical protein